MSSLPTSMSDECLAEKFRQEYNEQFHILVRMHLSFVLDLQMTTEDGEWFFQELNTNSGGNGVKLPKKFLGLYFGKKHHQLKTSGVNGPPLTQEGICQVYQLIEHLKHEQNITSEGIFRRTGSLERMQELRGLLSRGVTVDLSSFRVHDCASVLKGFLAELPEPLLTESHFPVYCQIAELCGVNGNKTQESKLLEAIQLLLLLLPIENKVLLKDILELLHLTAAKEESNKMSPENLAKLFTPHLLFPRKLSPEYLLQSSQSLFGIVAFMIRHWQDLFKIPAKLMVDFRVRYDKKSNPHAQPSAALLNESVDTAANTVFTFVDHERTAKENESNPTETALAQLYAHIQSLPESAKKRKLVKQFNKENGHGTPLQVKRSGGRDALHKNTKRNIFLQKAIKGRKLARPSSSSSSSSSSTQPNVKNHQELKTRILLCASGAEDDSHTDSIINEDSKPKKQKLNSDAVNSDDNENDDSDEILKMDNKTIEDEKENTYNTPKSLAYLTSTPAIGASAATILRASTSSSNYNAFTPDNPIRKSMSPITRSTHRMTKAMQETMMTPRSRKPVLLVSGTNIHALPTTVHTPSAVTMEQITEEKPHDSKIDEEKQLEEKNEESLTTTFKDYLSSRNMLTTSRLSCDLSDLDEADSPPIDSTFSSRTDDFNSSSDDDVVNIPNDDEGGQSKMSDSLLFCLNGGEPPIIDEEETEEKMLVLKPKQFDKDGKPIVFETSF